MFFVSSKRQMKHAAKLKNFKRPSNLLNLQWFTLVFKSWHIACYILNESTPKKMHIPPTKIKNLE